MPSRPEQQWPFRWELLLRYRFIETIALWEGRLTTRHLCDTFGIGRQQASKDINNYLREVGPGNLEYDKFLKGYKPATAFRPMVTQGLAEVRGKGNVSAILAKYGFSDANLFFFPLNN